MRPAPMITRIDLKHSATTNSATDVTDTGMPF